MHKCKNFSGNYEYLNFNSIQNYEVIKKNIQIGKKDYITNFFLLYYHFHAYVNLKFYKIERNLE